MQKIFALFLLIPTMCVSICWCGSEQSSLEPASAVIEEKIEDKDDVSVATPSPYIGDTNVSEPAELAMEVVEPTEDIAVIMHYTEDEVVMIAKLLHRECGGVSSVTEQACVAWTVCNRVDSDEFDGDTVTEIVTARCQFAYYYNTPVSDEFYELALDVLTRWNAERNGEESVGRVLPKEYTYFTGDGKHNYFRDTYKGNYSIWDYSLPSPYES